MSTSPSLTFASALLALCFAHATPPRASAQTDASAPLADTLAVSPVSHASFVLAVGDDVVVYNDPVGGADAYAALPEPTLVLVSDIHGDHLDTATLASLVVKDVALVVPAAVAEQLPPDLRARATVLANGDTATVAGVPVEAVPMYNLREEALEFHTKGRGNGYVVELGGERVYIAGDTEDIPEMRGLTDVDRAFVPMNLPYTMPVDAAASAVVEFAPAIVYPYHYRGAEGFSDTDRFAELVAAENADIVVRQLNWYPEEGSK